MSKVIFLSVISVFIISLSFIEVQAKEGPSLIEGKRMYMHYCSACHGNNGNGKGFNAKNLDPRPANHTDSELMSRRSDKELYEAVSGGGKATGKSTLMPPWGNTLADEHIKSILLYLRKLCNCTGQ